MEDRGCAEGSSVAKAMEDKGCGFPINNIGTSLCSGRGVGGDDAADGVGYRRPPPVRCPKRGRSLCELRSKPANRWMPQARDVRFANCDVCVIWWRPKADWLAKVEGIVRQLAQWDCEIVLRGIVLLGQVVQLDVVEVELNYGGLQ